jgi:hypothetical protein
MPYTNLTTGSRTTSYAPTAWHEGRTETENFGPDPMAMYRKFMAGSGGGAGGATGPWGPAPDLPPWVQGAPQADRRAAESAAFGRAKDRTGKLAGGAMKGLMNQMSSRGMRGSSIEGRGIGGVTAQAQGQLGDVIRQQAIEGLRRDQQVEDRDYAGQINQRSTDIGATGQYRGQDLTARGQDIQAQQTPIDILRMFMSRY